MCNLCFGLASQIVPKRIRSVQEAAMLTELTDKSITESLTAQQNFAASRSTINAQDIAPKAPKSPLMQAADDLWEAWQNFKQMDSNLMGAFGNVQ